MRSHFLRGSDLADGYEFEELPKGTMLGFSMNPYKGYVFLQTEKHRSCTVIGLQLMREIVDICDRLERDGSTDPLRDLVEAADGGSYGDLLRAARDADEKGKVKFAARRGDKAKRKAS